MQSISDCHFIYATQLHHHYTQCTRWIQICQKLSRICCAFFAYFGHHCPLTASHRLASLLIYVNRILKHFSFRWHIKLNRQLIIFFSLLFQGCYCYIFCCSFRFQSNEIMAKCFMLHVLSCATLYDYIFAFLSPFFILFTQFFRFCSLASSKIGIVVSWFFFSSVLLTSRLLFFAILFGFYAAHIVCAAKMYCDWWNTIQSM